MPTEIGPIRERLRVARDDPSRDLEAPAEEKDLPDQGDERDERGDSDLLEPVRVLKRERECATELHEASSKDCAT